MQTRQKTLGSGDWEAGPVGYTGPCKTQEDHAPAGPPRGQPTGRYRVGSDIHVRMTLEVAPMHAPLPASWVPPGFLFCPDGDLTVALGGPTARYLEAGGATVGPSGPTTPPPPPGPNAPSGLTAASCGQTTHRKEVDGTTATQGG
jgi:hypothetical protein